ncbi:MAG TPA: hypothetical protein VK186_00470, partial [Candidatus Deferrimicrobium sp.]|nr:hypothetical protein [Candidatus Deferrimicrobium sp.]
SRGFRVKDQTLWAHSVSGKHMGELDIKIEDETGRAVSIIEALNMYKYEAANIDRHVKKLLIDYDCNGLKENYIVVYVSAADFNGLCRKYRQRLEEIDYESYGLISGIDDVPTGLNKIKAYRARHRCNDGETILYHLLAKM